MKYMHNCIFAGSSYLYVHIGATHTHSIGVDLTCSISKIAFLRECLAEKAMPAKSLFVLLLRSLRGGPKPIMMMTKL
jgi:hypothetical protein